MALPLNEGDWSLDPAHSTVEFAVRHLGISTIRGRFGTVEATLAVGADLDSSSLSAEIDMSSVDTGNADRDAHLRGTDFFDVDTQPKMAFSSASMTEQADGSYQVVGDLTINGQTHSQTLETTFSGTETFPMDGSIRAGFEARTRIDRTAYGISFNVPLAGGGVMLSDEVDVVMNAQLVGPSAD